jgi:dTDP-4-amino-4,6-dideoxygalactose transaminase
MINVTKTYLPPLEDYIFQLERIWKNEWLTNRGELVNELEEKLKAYLGIDNIIVMNNGTIPLQIALKLLANNGEVITTPFSYVATTAAIIWENCTPVFVDIHPDYLTIDESKIEAVITDKTTCILATHVFGNPCNIEAIETIAKRHKLKVIYDAAHCFGVTYKGKSIFEYGDISTCSFHATKLFHTGEGGALFTNDTALFQKCFYSHNFGHNGPLDFHGLGINGKISELQAAMGLSVFPKMQNILLSRRKIVEFYTNTLSFSFFKNMTFREDTSWNYSYYPVIFDTEDQLISVLNKLNENGIFPRRYFNPSLNTIDFVNGDEMQISESISSKILCLPLSHSILDNDLNTICNIINNSNN